MGLGEQPDAEAFDGKARGDKGEAQPECGQQDERDEGNDESGHEQQAGGEPQTISFRKRCRGVIAAGISIEQAMMQNCRNFQTLSAAPAYLRSPPLANAGGSKPTARLFQPTPRFG